MIPAGDDIPEIHRWTAPLGRNYPPTMSIGPKSLVLLVRGDLIRKYGMILAVLNRADVHQLRARPGRRSRADLRRPTRRGRVLLRLRHRPRRRARRQGAALLRAVRGAGRVRFGLDAATAAVRRDRFAFSTAALPFPLKTLGRDADEAAAPRAPQDRQPAACAGARGGTSCRGRTCSSTLPAISTWSPAHPASTEAAELLEQQSRLRLDCAQRLAEADRGRRPRHEGAGMSDRHEQHELAERAATAREALRAGEARRAQTASRVLGRPTASGRGRRVNRPRCRRGTARSHSPRCRGAAAADAAAASARVPRRRRQGRPSAWPATSLQFFAAHPRCPSFGGPPLAAAPPGRTATRFRLNPTNVTFDHAASNLVSLVPGRGFHAPRHRAGNRGRSGGAGAVRRGVRRSAVVRARRPRGRLGVAGARRATWRRSARCTSFGTAANPAIRIISTRSAESRCCPKRWRSSR